MDRIAEIKDLIVQLVTDCQGLKGVELVTRAVEEVVQKYGCLSVNIPNLLDTLVGEERLLEIEYVLPTMDHQIKSFYLPANAQIRLSLNISSEEKHDGS